MNHCLPAKNYFKKPFEKIKEELQQQRGDFCNQHVAVFPAFLKKVVCPRLPENVLLSKKCLLLKVLPYRRMFHKACQNSIGRVGCFLGPLLAIASRMNINRSELISFIF